MRPPSRVEATPLKVVHVTTSFDIGGTQRQIQHLITSERARYRHTAIEIFPELNFLFREGERVDAARYMRGGALGRMVGRAIVDRDKRGSHLVQVAKLVRDFRVERPSIVAGWGHEICLTTFMAAALVGVPVAVFCIRTANPTYGWADDALAALLRDAHRRVMHRVGRVIVNSSFLQQDHAAWAAIDPAQIAVCPNGISADCSSRDERERWRKQVRARLGISEDAIVVSNIGRLSKEKGQLALLEAGRLLHPDSVPVVWLLCGDGPSLSSLEETARARGMANVRFFGRTRNVREVLAASDIFVMPSDFEGMPNAMMEAMAAGLPCISTTRSGIRDIAREDVEALYYEPGDIALLAQHVQSLVDNAGKRSALGAAAMARVREFSVDRFVASFESILDKAGS
jgi:glycosyltransferase involved in cell wall biosynthesis